MELGTWGPCSSRALRRIPGEHPTGNPDPGGLPVLEADGGYDYIFSNIHNFMRLKIKYIKL